jgi:hypothetical protein
MMDAWIMARSGFVLLVILCAFVVKKENHKGTKVHEEHEDAPSGTRRERRDPLASRFASAARLRRGFGGSPSLTREREAGRVGRAEVVSRLRAALLQHARVERAPIIGRYSRTGLGLALLTPMETNRGP